MISESNLTAAKILIVDDEPSNVVLLQYILRSAGYDAVCTTTDSREAIRLFEEHQPDLILLDLMMPHLSGFEIMRLLGERVTRADCLPILILTADVSADTKYQALQAGASDFLTKPFDHVEALLRIRHLLQIRSQHLQIARQRDWLEETVAQRTGELRATCNQLEETLDELRQTQEKMVQQERMSALGSMAAGFAHDFNNSLALILGYSELLQGDLAGTPYEPRSEEFLGTIITAAQDAAKMFNRLRTFYRSQETEDTHGGVNLSALVEQAAALTRPRWHGQALGQGVTIRLALELAPELPELLADAAELREMLTNLIFNAVDAMPEGGTLTLRTRRALPAEAVESGAEAEKLKEALVLEVADTGTGMDEETRRRCLEPFFTTKGARGTGLGLAMVYGTVQRHGGSITLASRVGEGTCFSLNLPLHPLPRVMEDADSQPAGNRASRRVLVVDDEPSLAGILQRYLVADGHTVETAGSGSEALDKIYAADAPGYDLVVTDQGMPGMCGEELAKEAKALAPSLRVILVSGFGELEEAGKHHPAVDVVLMKPLTQSALRGAVQHVATLPKNRAPSPVEPRRTRLLPTLRAFQARIGLGRRAA